MPMVLQNEDLPLSLALTCINFITLLKMCGTSLLASLYNPKVNPAMASTVRFYDRHGLYGSSDVRNYRMPNFFRLGIFCY